MKHDEKLQLAIRIIDEIPKHERSPSKIRSIAGQIFSSTQSKATGEAKTRKISSIVAAITRKGFTGSPATKSKRKKIIYASRWAFTRGIWRRGYRAYHYEPDQCPNSPYWMALNNLPPALSGRFILFEGVHNYAIYENMNRIISLSKRQVKY